MTKSHLPSVEQLSLILWTLDPMNTCCNCNYNAFDEYDGEAKMIIEECESGKPLKQAVVDTFDYWFWEDCLDKPSCPFGAEEIIFAIDEYLCIVDASVPKTELDESYSEREIYVLDQANCRFPVSHQIGLDYYKKYRPPHSGVEIIYI